MLYKLKEKPEEKKIEKNVENKVSNFLVYNIPRPFVSVHKKNQANWSSSLAGYAQHTYECLVLLYIFYVTYSWTKLSEIFLGNPWLKN